AATGHLDRGRAESLAGNTVGADLMRAGLAGGGGQPGQQRAPLLVPRVGRQPGQCLVNEGGGVLRETVFDAVSEEVQAEGGAGQRLRIAGGTGGGGDVDERLPGGSQVTGPML